MKLPESSGRPPGQFTIHDLPFTIALLRLLRDSETMPADRIGSLLEEAEELIRILTKIVKTGQAHR